MKKIYFAASIRGGRDDAPLYREMIAFMQCTDRVLTEHIGSVRLEDLPHERAGDAAIYEKDTAWLRESDLVIAECSTPSLGVGYELAYAEARGIPCHVFYRRNTGLSAMIAGDPYFCLHPYDSREALFRALEAVLGE